LNGRAENREETVENKQQTTTVGMRIRQQAETADSRQNTENRRQYTTDSRQLTHYPSGLCMG
jgi:hypothetical protein